MHCIIGYLVPSQEKQMCPFQFQTARRSEKSEMGVMGYKGGREWGWEREQEWCRVTKGGEEALRWIIVALQYINIDTEQSCALYCACLARDLRCDLDRRSSPIEVWRRIISKKVWLCKCTHTNMDLCVCFCAYVLLMSVPVCMCVYMCMYECIYHWAVFKHFLQKCSH